METQKSIKPELMLTDDTTVVQSGLFTGEPTVIAEPANPLEIPFPPMIHTHP